MVLHKTMPSKDSYRAVNVSKSYKLTEWDFKLLLQVLFYAIEVS